MTTPPTNTYTKVQELIQKHHGTMAFYPMGRGGEWRIELHGKTGVVPVPNMDVNALDRLYVPSGHANPQTSTEYANHNAEFVDEKAAFWAIIGIIQAGS